MGRSGLRSAPLHRLYTFFKQRDKSDNVGANLF